MTVGITGGIGSGKSTIAQALAQRGWVLYDSDKEAKRIIVTDPTIRQQVVALLGEEVFVGDEYQTRLVAQKVFSNRELLDGLNRIVHPAVKEDIRRQAARCKTRGENLLVENAVMIEGGFYEVCDKIILVTAPMPLRIQRTMARDNTTEEKVRARIQSQLSNDERAVYAQIVVANDGTKTIEQLCQYINQHL